MLRRLIAALVMFVLCLGVAFAAELKGKVTKVEDGKRKVILVKEEGKDKDTKINVGKNTKFVDADGKEAKLEDVKEGAEVVVTYEEKESKKDPNVKNKLASEIKIKAKK